MRLDIKQANIQKLSAKVEQSVRILQMDAQELEEYISDAMLDNPIIEVEYPEVQPEPEELFFERYRYSVRRSSAGSSGPVDVNRALENVAAPGDTSITHHLLSQVRCQYDEDSSYPIRYLIHFVDENGYLDPDFDSICAMNAFSCKELTDALKKLQSLDPPGVGASTLQECLCLQLLPEDNIAREIISEYINDVALGNTGRISRKLRLPLKEVEEAVIRIKKLSPKPGAAFSSNGPVDRIIPDIIVYKNEDGKFEATIPGTYTPTLYPNRTYMRLAAETTDSETREYLKNKIEQYKWICKCIESRNKTITELSKIIIDHQERFFKFGPSFLNTFKMKDAADILGVHESTVSRAVNGKYLLCEHGTFPLKHFFVRSLQADVPNISVLDAKREITKIILNEDSVHPLSDRYISERLNSRGIPISRRTVAKYRAQLGIGPTHLRAKRH